MRRLALTALTLALLALPVWAETVEYAAGASGGEGKLPQFREEYFPGQLFWLGVAFVLLYLLLKNVALPRIARVQDARAQQRAGDLDAAAAANERAKQIIADYEKSLAAARSQAQQKLSGIAQTAQAQAAHQQAQQQKLLQDKLHAAEQNIAALRVQAMSQVRDAAIDVAQQIVHRLTGVETSAAAVIDRLKRDAA